MYVTEARRAEQVAREEQERHEREQQRQRGETERQTKEALSEKGICWINIANLCISRPYWKVREGRIRKYKPTPDTGTCINCMTRKSAPSLTTTSCVNCTVGKYASVDREDE